MIRCQDCLLFKTDYVGSKGALHGTCLLRDLSWSDGGWRRGSGKACKDFTPETDKIILKGNAGKIEIDPNKRPIV